MQNVPERLHSNETIILDTEEIKANNKENKNEIRKKKGQKVDETEDRQRRSNICTVIVPRKRKQLGRNSISNIRKISKIKEN